jgi:hypothetical protein
VNYTNFHFRNIPCFSSTLLIVKITKVEQKRWGSKLMLQAHAYKFPHILFFSLQNSAISPSLILLEKTFVSSIKMSTARHISDDDGKH